MQKSMSTSTSTPQVYISVKRNRLKIYQHNQNFHVLLQNGTEFELELVNNTPFIHKADIIINGKQEKYAIVLKPGEHLYLERFMDDNRKFKFETYSVDDSQEVRDAIENNGTVEVKFYKERQYVPTFITHSYTTWYNSNPYGQNTIICDSVSPNSVGNTTRGMQTKGITTNAIASAGNLTFNCYNMSAGDTKGGQNISKRYNNVTETLNDASIETGRVEKGNVSNQEFRTVNYEFEYSPCFTQIYKLLPESRKSEILPSSAKLRKYCVRCQAKLKQGWRVCPHCGQPA